MLMGKVIVAGAGCDFSGFLYKFLRLAFDLQNGNAYKAQLPASLAERGQQVLANQFLSMQTCGRAEKHCKRQKAATDCTNFTDLIMPTSVQ
jgi:hypothetical protein